MIRGLALTSFYSISALRFPFLRSLKWSYDEIWQNCALCSIAVFAVIVVVESICRTNPLCMGNILCFGLVFGHLSSSHLNNDFFFSIRCLSLSFSLTHIITHSRRWVLLVFCLLRTEFYLTLTTLRFCLSFSPFFMFNLHIYSCVDGSVQCVQLQNWLWMLWYF